jgi:predicted enzyme related to lactoylglutathione lyase
MSERGTQEQMVMPKHGEFCWTEIATTDTKSCQKFYSELFGWEFKESNNDEIDLEYLQFNNGEGRDVGGLFKMKAEFYGGTIPPAHFLNYIAVDDVEASVRQAEELGGTPIGEPIDIPKVGRMAVIKDPTGATFSLIQLKY